MLTGDSEKTAREVAQTLGIDEYHAEILPEDKSEFIKQCQREGHRVAMVGDGINDSPALACADVSIAMSDASDIARAVADVSIHNTSLNSPVIAHRISTLLMRRIHEDFYGIVAVNTSLIVLGLLGLIPAIHAAYVHNGFTFAVTLRNTLPLLRDVQAREVQDDRRLGIV
ncbi:cation transporter E1-E2 family ATPase [Chlamydia trachomatis]|nr:cation transporter E1-E2 family ATPase [Chlamydia trachomatis]